MPVQSITVAATGDSTRSSQERDVTAFEDQYIGPTSGITFLHRAKGRLRQAFSSTAVNSVESTNLAPSSIFTFGDKPSPNYSGSSFRLPSREQARELVKQYFNFAIPTYTFLHQATVEGWLERLYDEGDTIGAKGRLLADRKAAVVLMVLATSTRYWVDEAGSVHDVNTQDSEQR